MLHASPFQEVYLERVIEKKSLVTHTMLMEMNGNSVLVFLCLLKDAQ